MHSQNTEEPVCVCVCVCMQSLFTYVSHVSLYVSIHTRVLMQPLDKQCYHTDALFTFPILAILALHPPCGP